MSSLARETFRKKIPIDAMRAVEIEWTLGRPVNLAFLVAGIKAAEQPIPAEVSQAIGAALMIAGRAAAGVGEAGNA